MKRDFNGHFFMLHFILIFILIFLHNYVLNLCIYPGTSSFGANQLGGFFTCKTDVARAPLFGAKKIEFVRRPLVTSNSILP